MSSGLGISVLALALVTSAGPGSPPFEDAAGWDRVGDTVPPRMRWHGCRKFVVVTRAGTWKVSWGQNTRLASTVPDSECFSILRQGAE
jgi:hypothetical protein